MATKQPSKRLSHLQLAESQPNHVSQQCGASKGTAFCSSAHLEEDNTKVSDSVQRRRIQNKIAQRKYRSKIKQQIETLKKEADAQGNKHIIKADQSAKPRKPQRSQSPQPQPCPPRAASEEQHCLTPSQRPESDVPRCPPTTRLPGPASNPRSDSLMSHESTLADTYTHSAHSDEVHLVSTRLSALPFSPDCLKGAAGLIHHAASVHYNFFGMSSADFRQQSASGEKSCTAEELRGTAALLPESYVRRNVGSMTTQPDSDGRLFLWIDSDAPSPTWRALPSSDGLLHFVGNLTAFANVIPAHINDVFLDIKATWKMPERWGWQQVVDVAVLDSGHTVELSVICSMTLIELTVQLEGGTMLLKSA